MRITSSGRFVFRAQWVLPVLLTLFLLFGRGLVGSPLGWMAFIGIWIAFPLLIAMYVPPLLTLADREVRAAGATRRAYSIASWVLWVALVVTALTVVDGGDSGEVGSALTVWTGEALSSEVSMTLMIVGGLVSLTALAVTFVLAILGIVRSRSAHPTPNPTTRAAG